MSQFTNYAENKLIDFMRAQLLTLPDFWHIGLISGFTSDQDAVEFTGSDYGRVPVDRSLTAWAGTQGAGSTTASSGTSHATSNNEEIYFGFGLDGEATHFGIWDASTGGNLWAAIPLIAPLTIGPSDEVSFPAGTIAMTLGLSGGLSDYGSNKLIDLLFRDQPYTWPATTYVAYTTTMPTNSTPGTEPLGGYARVAIASSLTEWSGTDGPGSTAPSTGESGRMANINPITFPVPTADQGDAVGTMLMDAATTGNMLMRGALLADGVPTPFTINASGDAPRFEANAFGVSVL